MLGCAMKGIGVCTLQDAFPKFLVEGGVKLTTCHISSHDFPVPGAGTREAETLSCNIHNHLASGHQHQLRRQCFNGVVRLGMTFFGPG